MISPQVQWETDDHVGSPKVIVFLSALLALFSVCRVAGCGKAVDSGNIGIKYKGGCVKITATCNANHVFEVWWSHLK